MTLAPQQGPGRPRTKCEACSPPRLRDVRRRAPHKLAAAPAAPSGAVVGVTAATLAKVRDACVEDDPAAQAALVLAARIDAGADSGASIAAMVKQLHATMAVALEHAELAADPIDELRRRREARRAGA